MVGTALGDLDGREELGTFDGEREGIDVLGAELGDFVGRDVVGANEGDFEGLVVGAIVGSDVVGEAEGDATDSKSHVIPNSSPDSPVNLLTHFLVLTSHRHFLKRCQIMFLVVGEGYIASIPVCLLDSFRGTRSHFSGISVSPLQEGSTRITYQN